MRHRCSRYVSLVVRSICFVLFFASMTIGTSGRGQPTASYTVVDLGSLGGGGAVGSAINAAGQVTGVGSVPIGMSHAFLYSGGVISDLGTLGGTLSLGSAINAAGQITGWAHVPGDIHHAFRYGNGALTDLGTLGGAQSIGMAINAGGQVTGWADTADNQRHAFLYRGGALIDLGTFGGSYSFGQAINDAGQVTGFAGMTGNTQERAFLYSGGALIDLGTFGGVASRGQAINALGQITGYALTAENETHAFVYRDGSLIDIGTLGGTQSFGMAINAAGQVTGYSLGPGDSPERAFLYSGGPLIDIGTFGGPRSEGLAINSAGQVVGWAQTAGDETHAFLYGNGVMTDLNTLIPADSGWMLADARAINDNGQITGFGYFHGEGRGFLLSPTQTRTAAVQPPIDSDGSSVFNASRGAIPVKFSLSENGTPTCELPPATIAVSRIAGSTIGPIDESDYLLKADTGSDFRIADCQYVYNLAAASLGKGAYRVDVKIGGIVVGSAMFTLK